MDLYTRWTLYSFAWLEPASTLLALTTRTVRRSDAPLPLLFLVGALAVAQALSSTALMRSGINQYLGNGTVSRRQTVTGVALMAGTVGWALALAWVAGLEDEGTVAVLLTTTTAPFLGTQILVVRVRTAIVTQLAVATAAAAGVGVIGGPVEVAVGAFLTMLVVTGWIAFTVRCSAWVLAVLWELDAARGVQARLAVAEERLRFSRDMHDVVGRNLAVIALKSELAVQLSRRGSPSAVDQMTEVQRIAQDSQREVRDVVRGYREADLHTELVGARSVLRAAGVDCQMDERSAPPAGGGRGGGRREGPPGGHGEPPRRRGTGRRGHRTGRPSPARPCPGRGCRTRCSPPWPGWYGRGRPMCCGTRRRGGARCG
ncbi:sensor histidine kinase [Streptomyces pactum]|uniref:Sensor histidine kinase n=1 Tax=Streptomyces pactum TaxID=68249 RepID=A0ABS0NLZ4_9ACTN|nr:histidine kinase dimerization/phosphoacceptor domain-containing protein [Streptomyces pactum]MBH5336201.1 sensor histidine kinase [Streptomyces pactum]